MIVDCTIFVLDTRTCTARYQRKKRTIDFDLRFYSHEVGSVVVDDGAEGQAVSPGRRHVGHLHPSVSLGDVLAPLQ